MGKQHKGVSLEDVAEEVLNGLFCHYEPPTSDEYQRRVAEEIRKNPNYAATAHQRYRGNKSILRPSGGGGYRDYGKQKTVTWRDEQRRHDDLQPDMLQSTPPASCLGTGWEILNAKLTDHDPRVPQPPKEDSEDLPSGMPPVPKNGIAGDYRKRSGEEMMDRFEDRKSPRASNRSPKHGKGGPILYDDEGYPVTEEDDDDGIVDENMPPDGFRSGVPICPSPRDVPSPPAMFNPFSWVLTDNCWGGVTDGKGGITPKSDIYTSKSEDFGSKYDKEDSMDRKSPHFRRVRSPAGPSRYTYDEEDDDDDMLDDADSYEARAPNRVGRFASRSPMVPYPRGRGRRPTRPPSPGREGDEQFMDEEHPQYGEAPMSPSRKTWYKRWRRPQTPHRGAEFSDDEEAHHDPVTANRREDDPYDSDGLRRGVRGRSSSRERSRPTSPYRDDGEGMEGIPRRGRSRSPARWVDYADYENMPAPGTRRRSASAERKLSNRGQPQDYYDDEFQGRTRRYSHEYEDIPTREFRRQSVESGDRRPASFDYNGRRSSRDTGYGYDYRSNTRSPRGSDVGEPNASMLSKLPREQEPAVRVSSTNMRDTPEKGKGSDRGQPLPLQENRGRSAVRRQYDERIVEGRERSNSRGKYDERIVEGRERSNSRSKYEEEFDYFPEDGGRRQLPNKERRSRMGHSRRTSDPTPAHYRPMRRLDDVPDYDDYDRRRPHSTTSHPSRQGPVPLNTQCGDYTTDYACRVGVVGCARPDPTPRRFARDDGDSYDDEPLPSMPLPPTPRRDERDRGQYRRNDDREDDDSVERRGRRLLRKQFSPTSQNTDEEIREEVSSVGMESHTIRPQYPNPFLAQGPPNPFLSVPPILEENPTSSDSDPSTLSSPPLDNGAATMTIDVKKEEMEKATNDLPASANNGSVGSSKKSFLGTLRKRIGKVKAIAKELDKKGIPLRPFDGELKKKESKDSTKASSKSSKKKKAATAAKK